MSKKSKAVWEWKIVRRAIWDSLLKLNPGKMEGALITRVRSCMKKNLWISLLMTMATTVLFGLVYPLVVTALAQLIFPHKANGQLIVKNGTVVGSSIIGQGFSGPAYFHSRLSAAGNV